MLRLFLALWLSIMPAFAWAGSMTLLGAGKAGTGGAVSTPAQIYGTNLTNWYEAFGGSVSCSGACSNGATVSSATDLSGNGNTLVPNFTNPTTFHSTGLGGKESLGFVLSGALGTSTNGMSNMGTGQGSACFMLVSSTISSSGTALGYAATGESSGSGAHSIVWFDFNTTPAFTWDHSFGSGTNRTVTANTEVIVANVVDGVNGTVTSYINGVQVGSTDAITFAGFISPGTFVMGAGSNGLQGEVRAAFCANVVPTAPQLSASFSYMVSIE